MKPVHAARQRVKADCLFLALEQPDQWPAVRNVEPHIGQVTQRPEVVDDFIRNFLVKMGLTKTLEMFETEWSVSWSKIGSLAQLCCFLHLLFLTCML